ncbi:hypothetical protein [Roseiconus lacunae]|uniref:hypothetical protein n=1 Tax=Roseiconus lacunae TaxID=2605694 RepID=UPI001E43682D|nr:hypothetical protein [Roseiconus lacunae]MCD0460417.1 hypothetical protein [Roseiconus lacunae]
MANAPNQTFQQSCPHCDATLELPHQAAGKRSLCPSCDQEFVAQLTTSGDTDRQPRAPQQNDEQHLHKVSIETIFGDTQTLFAVGRRKLFLPGFVIGGLLVLLVVVPLIGLNQYAQTNANGAITITLVLSPLFLLVIAYVLSVGLYLSDQLCNVDFNLPVVETSSWLSDSFKPGWKLVIRTAVTVLLLFLLNGVGLLVTALTISVASNSTRIGTTLLLYGFGFLISVLIPVFLAMSFWPLLPLCLTDRPLRRNVHPAITIAFFDPFNSFLIAVATTCLIGIGVAMVGMGLMVTLPLTVLLLVVAVRRSTGQSIAVLDQ